MNDKLKNVVVTIAFVFIIVIFFIANIIKKDDTISIAERRKDRARAFAAQHG